MHLAHFISARAAFWQFQINWYEPGCPKELQMSLQEAFIKLSQSQVVSPSRMLLSVNVTSSLYWSLFAIALGVFFSNIFIQWIYYCWYILDNKMSHLGFHFLSICVLWDLFGDTIDWSKYRNVARILTLISRIESACC